MKLNRGIAIFGVFFTFLYFSAQALLADIPAIHGMLLFGEKQDYASHLPMFHNPHNYQVVYSLTLEELPGQNTVQKYQEAKKTADTYFTIVPERMDLTKLMDGTIAEFQSLIFLGHFERGGENLGPAKIKVQEFILNQKLVPDQAAAQKESYMVFGAEEDYYAAHIIGRRPNFDSIVKVSLDADLEKIVLPVKMEAVVATEPGVQTLPAVSDQFKSAEGFVATVEKVIYEEVGELQ